jgi:SHS2 domain-containing protein
VLDRVIYLIDTEGQLPVAADVRAGDGTLEVRLPMAGPDGIETFGAIPKAVSLHDLRFDRSEEGWSCGVTLDV